MAKFLLSTLEENFEPLKIAAIKGLEFLIENLGCSLDNLLPKILLKIIENYPTGCFNEKNLIINT